MDYLVMRLSAPLSSWGEPAVGEYRPTAAWPGESSLLGLCGAALGVARDDVGGQSALRDSFRFAIAVISGGDLLRDYHTAQVPGRSDLKGRPHRSRRDELGIPKTDLNTILSTRDYRQNGDWLVAVALSSESRWSLVELEAALQRPRYTLYLGRKSCPLASPLAARIFLADNAKIAFTLWLEATGDSANIQRIVWGDGVNSGVAADLSVPRKDRMISRKGWQFADRMENSHLVGG